MKRQVMTVGFADLSNFSRVARSIGEEGILDVLNESYRIAGDIILNNGGVIRKYIGDSILFTFNDATAAIKAAHEIANGFRKEVDDLTMRHYVSIATGSVWVGEIGHPDYMVEDIIGEVVNKAALGISDAHKSESGIYISDRTLKESLLGSIKDNNQ